MIISAPVSDAVRSETIRAAIAAISSGSTILRSGMDSMVCFHSCFSLILLLFCHPVPDPYLLLLKREHDLESFVLLVHRYIKGFVDFLEGKMMGVQSA